MAKGVGDVLYSILSNDTNISGIVSDKIYPFLAIEDVVYPYIVYTIEGVDPTQQDDGVSPLDVNSANVEIYSEDLSEIETLSKYVRNALDRYRGTVEGIDVQSVSFQSEDGGYADEDRVYLKIQSYSLRMLTITACFGRVTDLSAATISSTQINLSWSDGATGEANWEVWTSQDFINWSLVATIAADSTAYSVTGLTGGTSYSYKVRAIDGVDCGEWSNLVQECTSTAAPSVNISNSNDSYDVNTNVDLELPNINFTDSDGTNTSVPSMENLIATPCLVKSGIAYNKPQVGAQLTSYHLYDEAYNTANGVYIETPPANPTHTARLDTTSARPDLTLIDNNSFGNKNRFTDINGLQVYGNDYVIDHLGGYGIYRVTQGTSNLSDALNNTNSSTILGYTDWRVPTFKEFTSLQSMDAANSLGAPLNFAANYYWSCTYRYDGFASTYGLATYAPYGQVAALLKTSLYNYIMIRNHF